MANKKIQVDLLFNANTVNAKNNIQQLSTLLNSITKATPLNIQSGTLNEAVNQAQLLKSALASAVNIDTGRLDLTKFSASLKSGNTSISKLSTSLQSLGPVGEQTFMRLATAIATAQTPVITLGTRMSGLMKTLANTAKWQVASTAIHAISGAMTSAISHAKDLDKALNDIRIVTGYGAGSMKTFATQARDAAKALNTTSTEYAKAALIFYQQGLSGDEVTERADTVIKLSQVTGQSAEEVSSQMTAIWNNFADGSKSLEYYADALTKLGAATAASTDEIAQGLEKFAAISDTVGLSYEYATAALATVVDKTRQSADVVGTSFKTIFARIEGLTLGETLEDGTDLNKYSEAMAAVGVNIKDSNGELKNMNTILDELGEKWKIISKDQQIALAQQVGGLRQYNQMIALMDSWDDVKDNIDLAANATGELQKQADIWGQSQEAASKRLKASSQGLYENFLQSDDVTNITNLLADLISSIDEVIDSFGGVGKMILTLAFMFGSTLMPVILSGFSKTIGNLSTVLGLSQRYNTTLQQQTVAELSLMHSKEGTTIETKKQIEATANLITLSNEYASISKYMTKAQRQVVEGYISEHNELVQNIQSKQAYIEKTKEQISSLLDLSKRYEKKAKNSGQKAESVKVEPMTLSTTSSQQMTEAAFHTSKLANKEGIITTPSIDKLETTLELQNKYNKTMKSFQGTASEAAATLKKMEAAQQKLNKTSKGSSKANKEIRQSIQNSVTALKQQKEAIIEQAKSAGVSDQALTKLKHGFSLLDDEAKQTEGLKLIEAQLRRLGDEAGVTAGDLGYTAEQIIMALEKIGVPKETLDIIKQKFNDLGNAEVDVANDTDRLKASLDRIEQSFNNFSTKFTATTSRISSVAGSLMGVASSIQMLRSAFSDTGTAMDKFMAILMLMTTIIPIVNTVTETAIAISKKNAMAKVAETGATTGLVAAETVLSAVRKMGWKGALIGLAVAGVAVAGLAALTSSTTKNQKALERENEQQIANNEERQKTIDSILEATEAYREEADTLETLINQYNRMDKASAGVAEAQQKIVEQASATIEKLKELNKTAQDPALTQYIENLEAYAAAGDVEGVIEASEEANKQANKIAQQSADDFKAMTAAEAEKALVDGANRAKRTSDGVRWATGSAGATGEALAEAGMMDGRFVKLRTDSNENFVKDYEKLREIEAQLRESGHANEKQFAKLVDGLDAAKEQYETIKEQMDTGIQAADLETKLDELGIDPANIKTYGEYTAAKEKFIAAAEAEAIANGEDAEAAREAAEAYLEAKGALSDFVTAEDKLEYVKLERGKDTANALEEYVNSLSAEDMEIFLNKVDIQKYQTAGAMDDLIKAEKSKEKTEKIETRVEFLADFEGFADKTDEELMEIANNTDYGWGVQLMEFDKFLSMSAEEQKAYMAQQAEIQTEKLILEQEEVIAKRQAILATEGLTEAEYYNAQQELKAAENQKAFYEFQQRTREEERKKELKSRQEKIDALEEEIDLLHEIDVLQEDINDTISEYSKLADRAYGKDRLNYLQEEIKWMEKDIMVQEKRVEMTKDIMDSRRAELEAAIPGAQFDEEGRISNYNELLTNKIRETQQKIANTSDSDKIEEYEQELEDFKEFLEKYEDAAEDNQKAIIELAEKEREQLDKQLEGIEYAVEVKIEVEDRKLEQFKRRWEQSQVSGDIMDIPVNLVEYYNGSMASLNAKNSYNISGIEAILSSVGATSEQIAAYMSGDASAISGLETRLTEEQISALEKYTEGALETAAAMEELATVVNGQLNEAFTKTKDTIDTSISAYGTYSTMAQDFRNIIDTVGADVLGITETVERGLNKIIIDSAINTIEGTKTQIEVAQSALDEVNKILTEQELTPEARAYFEEQKNFYEQELLNAEAAFSSALSTAFQTIQEEFTRQIETAIDEFEDALAGVHFGSLEELSDAMEKAQQVSERYVSDYKKIYELNKLNRNIQKSLDQSTSLRTNSKLRDFQSEITELQAQGVELSEYQLEHVQKRYELLQAEIALEEARDAKNQVRLQRDQSGSWNYVYTIDEESVNDAAQGYEDAVYGYMELQDEALNDWQSRIIESQRSMVEELRAIQTDMSLTTQEKEAATARIVDYYVSEQQYLYGQLGITLLNNKNFYDGDYTNYSHFVNKQLWTTDEWVQGFNETVLGMETGYEDLETFANNFMEALGDKDDSNSILGKIHDNWMTYEDTLDAVAAAAGAPIGTMGDQVSGLGDIIAEKLWGKGGSADKPNGGMVGGMNDFKDSVDDAGNEAASAFPEIGKAIGDFYTAHYDQLSKTREQAENLDTALTDLKTDYTEGIDIKVDVTLNDGGVSTLLDRLENYSGKTISFGVEAQSEEDGGNFNFDKTLTQIASGYKGENYYLDEGGSIYSESDLGSGNLKQNEDGSFSTDSSQIIKDSTNSYLQNFEDRTNELSSGQADTFRSLASIDMNSYVIDKQGAGNKYYKAKYNSIDQQGNIQEKSGYVLQDDIEYNELFDSYSIREGALIYSEQEELPKTYKIKGISDPHMNALKKTLVLLEDNNVYYYKGGPLKGDTSDKVVWTEKELTEQRVGYSGNTNTGLFHMNGWRSESDGSKFNFYPEDWTSPGNNSPSGYIPSTSYKAGFVKNEGRNWINNSGKTNSESKTKEEEKKIFVSSIAEEPNRTYYRLDSLVGYTGTNSTSNSFYIPKGAQTYKYKYFNTGGYTGSWGPEGKLAVLHQKELILNAMDTENILSAVSLVRDISSQLDRNAAAMANSLSLVSAPSRLQTLGNDILQQDVHITAEFPSVTNHNEIEIALSNLINDASQYINKR